MQSVQPPLIAWTRDTPWHYARTTQHGNSGIIGPQPIARVRTNSSTAVEAADRTPVQKRRACNECRQQKLRCELANVDDPSTNVCARCTKLGLRCKIDESFKRTRKRKRSRDFESEIFTLKKKLSQYEHDTANLQTTWPRPKVALAVPLAAYSLLQCQTEHLSSRQNRACLQQRGHTNMKYRRSQNHQSALPSHCHSRGALETWKSL